MSSALIVSQISASSQLTAGVAWVIATYSLVFGKTARENWAIALFMSTWYCIVLSIGSSRILYDRTVLGAPAIGLTVAVPIFLLTTYFTQTKSGQARVRAASWFGLIQVQTLRVLGYWFIIMYNHLHLPSPFAPVAGYGDIAAGILALPVSLFTENPTIILLWNIFGAADLFAAVSLGLSSHPGPMQIFKGKPDSLPMTVLPMLLIPGFLVPSLFSLHLVVFYKLFAKKDDARLSKGRKGM